MVCHEKNLRLSPLNTGLLPGAKAPPPATPAQKHKPIIDQNMLADRKGQPSWPQGGGTRGPVRPKPTTNVSSLSGRGLTEQDTKPVRQGSSGNPIIFGEGDATVGDRKIAFGPLAERETKKRDGAAVVGDEKSEEQKHLVDSLGLGKTASALSIKPLQQGLATKVVPAVMESPRS
ncbi:hypothetical protein B0A55_08995 [Friedmanniomyces simplex]|uniref:Uncharacterized protein n=1 Tax=Friedmanniomyces simplex TaxID=329884 RepID=A0A4U0WYF7_9PEZI|nr:hypothetical protein B0A55_08995 [Friedmanniomyces simplex]